MKNFPVGAEMFDMDGRRGMKKVVLHFRNIEIAHKN